MDKIYVLLVENKSPVSPADGALLLQMQSELLFKFKSLLLKWSF